MKEIKKFWVNKIHNNYMKLEWQPFTFSNGSPDEAVKINAAPEYKDSPLEQLTKRSIMLIVNW